MSDGKQPFVSFMCFETDQEHEVCRSLAVVSSMSEAESWKQETRDTNPETGKSVSDEGKLDSSEPEEGEEEGSQHPSAQLSKLMTRFQETMSSYGPLVEFGMILMPSLRSHFIYNEMYKNASRHLEALDRDQQFETYGITADQYPAVRTQIRRLREFDRGVTVLPGAILLSLVATFDSFIADTIKIMLRCKPEQVIASSKTIGVKEVLAMSSFDDLGPVPIK